MICDCALLLRLRVLFRHHFFTLLIILRLQHPLDWKLLGFPIRKEPGPLGNGAGRRGIGAMMIITHTYRQRTARTGRKRLKAGPPAATTSPGHGRAHESLPAVFLSPRLYRCSDLDDLPEPSDSPVRSRCLPRGHRRRAPRHGGRDVALPGFSASFWEGAAIGLLPLLRRNTLRETASWQREATRTATA